jgi:hypothetical protein
MLAAHQAQAKIGEKASPLAAKISGGEGWPETEGVRQLAALIGDIGGGAASDKWRRNAGGWRKTESGSEKWQQYQPGAGDGKSCAQQRRIWRNREN